LLYKLCDQQPALKAFKAAVVAKYGEVPADADEDDSDDDSE